MKEKLRKYLNVYKEELQIAAQKLAGEEIPELTEELFGLYEETGNRIAYERVYFHRRKRLTVFGVLAMLDGRQEEVEQLEQILVEVCKERCWALPAHVDRRQKDWERTIDLFASETAFYLAELVGRLGDRISLHTRELVRNEVFRRVLTPYLQSEQPYAWWEQCRMNWCAVCNGAIGSAAIWMIEDSSVLNPLLQRICENLEHYIDGFCEDGACLEGIGYYTYGMSFYVAFAELLKKHTGGKINLLENKKMREIALFQQKCFLPGGYSVCFADSSSTEKFRMGLACYLKMQYPEVEIPDIRAAAGLESDDCYRYLMISRDFLFVQEYLEEKQEDTEEKKEDAKEKQEDTEEKQENAEEKQEDTEEKQEVSDRMTGKQVILPQAQWSISTGQNGSVLAVKGGHNDEPHNHNDVGSFFYMCNGEMVLSDIGIGEYTREYFNEKRYEQLCCRSLGHNLPLIDGLEQTAGAGYHATAFAGDGQGNTTVEIGQAYPLTDGERVERSLYLDMDTGVMRLEDTFLFSRERVVTENLVTCYRPELTDRGFSVYTRKCRYHITCDAGKKFRIIQKEFKNHQGMPEQVWLMQWEVSGNRVVVVVRQL